MQEKPARKAVLVISSHVIRGAVGSRVNVFALEAFGYPVWSMLTVSMPWQPRQGVSHRLAVSAHDFAAWAHDILQSARRDEIGAVLTGYFATAEQVAIAAGLIAALKQQQPGLVFLCDPVMGNEEGLYVKETIAQAIRDRLLPLATLIKPNRNELEWICGRTFTSNEDIITAAQRFLPAPVLVSSAFSLLENNTGNLLITEKAAWLAEHRRFATPVNGLGDLTSSLFLAYYLEGAGWRRALRRTTASVYEFLDYTLAAGADELAFAQAPLQLAHPRASVAMHRISSYPA